MPTRKRRSESWPAYRRRPGDYSQYRSSAPIEVPGEGGERIEPDEDAARRECTFDAPYEDDLVRRRR